MTKNRSHSALGPQLRAERQAAKISQAVLAQLVGCSLPTVRQAERGDGSFCGFQSLADALGMEIAGRSLPAGDTIGKRLALLRERRAISRRALAATVGVSAPTIAAIEADKAGHLSAVERVAVTLGAGLFLHPKGQQPTFWQTTAASSAHQAWTTPPELLERLYPVVGGAFDLDPCSPTPDRKAAPVRASLYFTDHGLEVPWQGSVFVNPPYGRGLKFWIKKCHDEAASGRASPVVALIPARPDTSAWHTWIAGCADVFMLRGRLRFGAEGGGDAAPFPSALVVWNATTDHRQAMQAAFPEAWYVAAATKGRG